MKVVRTPSRHGLIRAKNFGSKHATGDALIFLDSHCECTEGWLPPLLAALRDNPKTVVQPVIPGMNWGLTEKILGAFCTPDRHKFNGFSYCVTRQL